MISPLAARLSHWYGTARVSKRLTGKATARIRARRRTSTPIFLRLGKKWYRAPTRGVFKGMAQSELSVGAQVSPADAPPTEEEMAPMTTWVAQAPVEDDQQQRQQQL